MSYLALPDSPMSTLVVNWLVFDNSLTGLEMMFHPLMWRCRATPAAPPAVGVVVLVHHRVDQSLLSQSAPRSQEFLPLVLGRLELRFLG